MPDVPPDLTIRSTIKPGSVYYFPEDSFPSTEPHYFIVLNSDPLTDTTIILVCSSSRIDKVKRRRVNFPDSTLVSIDKTQYPGFSVPSIIDCNFVMEITISQLIEKLSGGKLQLKTEMDIDLVKKLRQGVLSSPLIEGRIKMFLK